MKALICNDLETMYVYQIHGVLFVSWVSISNINMAQRFSEDKAEDWLKIINSMSEDMHCKIMWADQ